MARGLITVYSTFIFPFTLAYAQLSPTLAGQDFVPMAPLRRPVNNASEKYSLDSRTVDGKGLLDSWLGKRQLTCDAGYGLCSSKPNLSLKFEADNTDHLTCCPTGDYCCGLDFCSAPEESCCTWGVCPAGWRCCSFDSCSPKDADCCANGGYCTEGNHCYLYFGIPSCCTDSHCTAYISSGTTIGGAGGGIDSGTQTAATKTAQSTPTSPASIPAITSTPNTSPSPTSTPTTSVQPSTITQEVYEWYTYTITW